MRCALARSPSLEVPDPAFSCQLITRVCSARTSHQAHNIAGVLSQAGRRRYFSLHAAPVPAGACRRRGAP